jgi:uncharacterized protein DUF4288
MKRYSAKLLFQFRVVVDGESSKMRTCEERIILINAASARQALRQAKRKGAKGEFDYTNTDGNPVYFEFLGVMDLIELGIECSHGEVWYDIVSRLLPDKRRRKYIPPESKLNAILHESRRTQGGK